MKIKDIAGQRFGRLVVIEISKEKKYGKICWLCKCDCGKQITATQNNLSRFNTTSCGCFKDEVSKQSKNSTLDSGLGRLYSIYKSSASVRNLSFSLSKEDFKELTSSKCHYCGVLPYKVYRSWYAKVPYTYNGIDRKDNSVGYDIDNCLPCCSVCNRAKHVLSYEEFESWLDRITKFRCSSMAEHSAVNRVVIGSSPIS